MINRCFTINHNKMYKLKIKTYLLVKFIKSKGSWFKRKFIVILVAFMIGISNGMYHENDTITKYQPKIEQQEKDD